MPPIRHSILHAWTYIYIYITQVYVELPACMHIREELAAFDRKSQGPLSL